MWDRWTYSNTEACLGLLLAENDFAQWDEVRGRLLVSVSTKICSGWRHICWRRHVQTHPNGVNWSWHVQDSFILSEQEHQSSYEPRVCIRRVGVFLTYQKLKSFIFYFIPVPISAYSFGLPFLFVCRGHGSESVVKHAESHPSTSTNPASGNVGESAKAKDVGKSATAEHTPPRHREQVHRKKCAENHFIPSKTMMVKVNCRHSVLCIQCARRHMAIKGLRSVRALEKVGCALCDSHLGPICKKGYKLSWFWEKEVKCLHAHGCIWMKENNLKKQLFASFVSPLSLIGLNECKNTHFNQWPATSCPCPLLQLHYPTVP